MESSYLFSRCNLGKSVEEWVKQTTFKESFDWNWGRMEELHFHAVKTILLLWKLLFTCMLHLLRSIFCQVQYCALVPVPSERTSIYKSKAIHFPQNKKFQKQSWVGSWRISLSEDQLKINVGHYYGSFP